MASERVQRQIDRLLDEAEAAVQQSNWALVQNRARNVLAFDPENRDAQAFLAAAERALSTPGASPAVQPDSPPSPIPAPPAYITPTSFAQGRYQVKRFLGEGGKKRVFLAHDTLLDRDVAFALIKAEGLDDVARSRIRREAQAMGRLGSHPHIVTVFDLGQEEGQPFMVAEFMGKGDVAGLMEKAPDHRLPLEQAVRIAVETCQGLEYAHQRGIIHRDLKPSNVWLTAPSSASGGSGQVLDTAKIGDFGLAVALDRSRLTQHGMMVGTVAYMPPEQALGGEVTARSDLYSLGAMLYEMVAGRPPFLGDDPVAIIGQHINTPPVAPTWHNGQCPRLLEALILRLLAKDPAERPQSAGDVLAALEAIDLTEVADDVGAHGRAPLQEAHALDSLAGGVFVGRQREMGELKAALEDALSGKGRLVTLVGEPGIGKTRTAQELATYAGLRQCQVLWGRCYEGQGAPPYWPWVQAIRFYVRDRDAAQVRSEMGAGAADIAEVVSDVRERLPDLKPPPQLEPEQARFRLFDSICAFLKSAGRRQPLVLILEDLHWADRPSLLLLEFVARELGGSRLMAIGTYRDVEVSRRHPLSQTLGELTRERLFQRILLRGLSQEDVGRFIELVAGITPPRGMVEAVYRQTEGNPLFVTEVVRLLVQEGELTPDVGAVLRGRPDSWTVRIPEGVREVIGRRLDRLSERCNQTLTIASGIGREFTLEQLKPLIEDMSEDRLLEVLEEALAARVIEELPRAVGRYQFTHALIQETLLEELTLTRRVRLHARIAEALEKLYGNQADAHAAELAHHFAEAQTVLGTDKLVRYSLVAGEKALASYGWEGAQAHFQRALTAKEGQPMDAQAAALLFGLGRAQVATAERHQLQEGVDIVSRAFDYYEKAGDVPHAVAVAEYPYAYDAVIYTKIGQLVAGALALVPPDSLQAGRLLSTYGRNLGLEESDYQGAQEAFSRALAIAQRVHDAGLELRTLADAALVDRFHFRFQECLRKSLRAIELARRLDDLRSEVVVRQEAFTALRAMGDLEGARQHADAMLAVAERLRDRSWLTSALVCLMDLSCLQGDWEEARDFTDRGLAVHGENTRSLRYRALLEYEAGDFTQGEAYLERLLESIHLNPIATYGLLASAISTIARITGDVSRSEVAKAAAQTVFTLPSVTPFFAASARVGLGLLAVLRGDEAAATEQYAALEPLRGAAPSRDPMVVDRVLGLLAQTMGQLDKAASHFEDALAFCRRAGYRPELAWTCCDYADLLLNPVGAALDGRPGHPPRRVGAPTDPANRAKAMALLDEALAISRELGMRPLMERVLSRREILTA